MSAKSKVIIPNVLASAVSLSIRNSSLMTALSISKPGSSVLAVPQFSLQNIVIPTAICKAIPVIPLIKVLHHSCGVPKPCFYCKAMRWPAENEISETCCSEGTVRLDAIQDPPEPLRSLLTGTHSQSSHFKKHHREYNCAFQMASSTAQIAVSSRNQLSVNEWSFISSNRTVVSAIETTGHICTCFYRIQMIKHLLKKNNIFFKFI